MTELAHHWRLDPEITYLNHGSFGACPTPVLEQQHELRARLEREPVAFFMRESQGLIDDARTALAAFLDVDGEDLAFVSNATEGVSTVLRSLVLTEGDELVTTDHAYNACRNALDFVAARSGARVVIAAIPFPLHDPDQVIDAVMAAITDRTRLVMLDHITSPTGLVLPLERILPPLDDRGIDCLVDGAHAAGMVDLSIGRLRPAYYTGNCHKWLCTPKGSGFLWVRRDHQQATRPLSISHGANSPRRDRSRFLLEFDWSGTVDPTPWHCIPAAIEFMGSLLPGGWPALRERNRSLVLAGRAVLCEALGIEPPAPASMVGSLATLPLPDGTVGKHDPMAIAPLQESLFVEERIEVPIMTWPAAPRRLLRISAQVYNDLGEYRRLALALPKQL